jgi:hypothetical protein
MKRSFFHTVLFLLMLAGVPALASTCVWEEVRKSTVYITVDAVDPATGAKTTSQGTGVVASRLGYVLTASHLLRDWIKQKDLDKAQNPIRASIGGKPGNPNISLLDVQVVNPGNSASEDVALLKLPPFDSAQGYSPAPICFASREEPKFGEEISALGFPLNQNIQLVTGALGTATAPGGRWAAASAFERGMSGGPVYDSSCNLIGLVKGGLPDTKDVQWITPVRHARPLLAMAELTSEECPTIGDMTPLNVTIVPKSSPPTKKVTKPAPGAPPFTTGVERLPGAPAPKNAASAGPPFKTTVERLSIESVLFRVVDGNSGDPIAHAFVEIVNPKNGKRLGLGETNKKGEYAFRSYYEELRIIVKDSDHEDLSAHLYIPNQDRPRFVIPMTNQCLAKN